MPSNSIFDSSITVSKLIDTKREETPIQEFARSAAYSAIQSPLNAIVQPIDRTFGTSLEKDLSLIAPAQEADFNTTSFWAQQAGHAAGMLPTFWLAGKCVKGVLRRGLTEEQLVNRLGQRGVLGLTLKEAALTGFVHDSLLRPTDHKDQRDFVASRLGNGATGALTMTTLTAAGMGLKGLGSRSEALNGLLAGLPAGFVNAQTDSLLRTGSLAKGEDLTKSLVVMSVIGGSFGTWHQIRGQHESGRANFEWSKKENGEGVREYRVNGGERALNEALKLLKANEPATLKVQEHLGPASGLKGWLGFQRFGPEQALMMQHGPNASIRLALSADLVASCNLSGVLRPKGVIDSPQIFLRAGENRLSFDSRPQQVRIGERPPIQLAKQSEISKDLSKLADRYSSDSSFRRANEGLQYHDLNAYAEALKWTHYEPVEFLGAGFESVAFLLGDGSVLKITRLAEVPGGQWNETWGTRSFDAKIKGEVKVLELQNGQEIAVYRQPQVEMGGIDTGSPEFRLFMKKVRAAGEDFWDDGYAGDQVGILLDSNGDPVMRPLKGKGGKVLRHEDRSPRMAPVIVLIDYPAIAAGGVHP